MNPHGTRQVFALKKRPRRNAAERGGLNRPSRLAVVLAFASALVGAAVFGPALFEWRQPAAAQVLKPKDAAIVPLAMVAPEVRMNVRYVVSKRTTRRIIDTKPFSSSVRIYRLLLDNLPLAARIANALEIDTYRIEARARGQFTGDDQHGLTGIFTLAYESPSKLVYYGEGEYDGKMLPKLKGRAVLVLQFGPAESDGQELVKNRLTAYVFVDHRLFGILLKPILPLFGKLVNRKLSRFITAAQDLSELLAKEPEETRQRVNENDIVSEVDKRCFNMALASLKLPPEQPPAALPHECLGLTKEAS